MVLAAMVTGACGVSDPFRISVPATLDEAVDSVAVSPSTAVATEIGARIQFVATPLDATGEALDATVSWRSSDITVATVDRFGVATAFAEGDAEILATSGDATGRAVLTVLPELDAGGS